MKCSICMAAYARPDELRRTLESIYRQHVPFNFEVIVVDDGTPGTGIAKVCLDFPARYYRIERAPGYQNPAAARNVAYRMALGDVVICQSHDVIHASPDCIERLVADLEPGQFLIATVVNVDAAGKPHADATGLGYGDKLTVYTSPEKQRPLFFLGSLWRRDLYTAGGNDEEFTDPSREDAWFALCLTRGLGLTPTYSADIIGHHQHHQHCTDYEAISRSRVIYNRKVEQASRGLIPWQASGGPWPHEPAEIEMSRLGT